jgi:hypothetical protein
MISITGTWLSGQFTWSVKSKQKGRDELTIGFYFAGKLGKRAALLKLERKIAEEKITWLRKDNKTWLIDLDALRKKFAELTEDKFLQGIVRTEADIEDATRHTGTTTAINFILTKSEILMVQSGKIFLSHKGKDKKLVRRFQRALEAIGFDVWIDEKNLKAGDHLERGILQGFKESCAAVFFITDNFKDETYLKSEINYAIEQTRAKENYFKIITLAFRAGKEQVEIPELLKSFVWKSPASELDALTEIIKALPLAPKHFDFKN